jgi:hypothetical protein
VSTIYTMARTPDVPGTLDLAIPRTLQNDALGRVMKHA